jgi:putative phosphonate metabolism protein
MTERYAIYFAPSETGQLWERASTWLGRDAASGDLFEGAVAGIDRNRLLNLTQSANRYGFHATIKAPMALVEGATEADLRSALTQFVGQHAPFSLGQLKLASLDGFLALIPAAPNEALQDFAAHVVESFDTFRAPMSVKDRAARVGKGLSERQIELLDAYGYPYVFEEFRFHMTLRDRLAEADAADIASAATTWFGPLLGEDVLIDSLSLFAEPEKGKPFRRIAEFPLGGAA